MKQSQEKKRQAINRPLANGDRPTSARKLKDDSTMPLMSSPSSSKAVTESRFGEHHIDMASLILITWEFNN